MNYNLLNDFSQYTKFENNVFYFYNKSEKIILKYKTKLNLKNGIYDIEKMKNNIYIQENMNIKFPIEPNINDNKEKIDIDALYDSLKYVSNDFLNDFLNDGLQFIHIDKNYIESSNAYIIYRKTNKYKNKEKFIHYNIIKLCKKLNIENLYCLENEKYFKLFNNKYEIISKKININYPNINNILSKNVINKIEFKRWIDIYEICKTHELIYFYKNMIFFSDEKNNYFYSILKNNVLDNNDVIGFNINHLNILIQNMYKLNIYKIELKYNGFYCWYENEKYLFIIMPMLMKDENIINKIKNRNFENFEKIKMKRLKKTNKISVKNKLNGFLK